jgi:hypothetical protein
VNLCGLRDRRVEPQRARRLDPGVGRRLVRRHRRAHGEGRLRRQLRLDVLDLAAQHEGLEDLVQPVDDDHALLLLEPVVGGAAGAGAAARLGAEPLDEGGAVLENVREEEVQEGPELEEVVLEGRAREEQPARGLRRVRVEGRRWDGRDERRVHVGQEASTRGQQSSQFNTGTLI